MIAKVHLEKMCLLGCLRLILEFELRTKELSGLVLYMARINHADFVSIQVWLLCTLINAHLIPH